MTDDAMIFAATLSLAGTVVLAWSLTKWRNAKGKTSVFASDRNLDDVGLSALSSLFDSFSPNRLDGITELRPTWGIRLIAPAIAAVFLFTVDFAPIFEPLGLGDPTHQSWAKLGIGAMLAYSWFKLLFVQKVEYDTAHIRTYGVDPTANSRDLSDLVDIRVHEKRPALVLTFAEQSPLYVPKFMSQRAKFLSDMEAIVARNLSAGKSAPEQTVLQKMGFS